MIQLSKKWTDLLKKSPESGMGYQIVSVILEDGSRIDQVAVVDGVVTKVRGRKAIPFVDADIKSVLITHDKWDFASE